MSRHSRLSLTFSALLLAAGCSGELLLETGPGPNDPVDPVGGADADPGGDPVETLSITFETTPVGGEYAPTNIVAVWIEDQAGVFVKTVSRYAGVRAQHLVAWAQASGLDADAVSGATRLNHQTPIAATWEGTNTALAAVPDGAYNIRIEVADDNSVTPGQNHQGTFPFDKNGTASTATLQGIGIQNVVLDYSGRLPGAKATSP